MNTIKVKVSNKSHIVEDIITINANNYKKSIYLREKIHF